MAHLRLSVQNEIVTACHLAVVPEKVNHPLEIQPSKCCVKSRGENMMAFLERAHSASIILPGFLRP